MKKITLSFIINFINKHHPGAKVLSTEYINYFAKLNIQCENGHYIQKTWSDIRNKDWCAYCYGNDKKSIEHVQKYLDKHHPGAKILSTEYKNNHTKLDIICEKGHNIKISYNTLKYHWCVICSGKDKKSIPYVQQYLNEHHLGAKVLSTEYKNSKTKLDIICEKGHQIKKCWNDIYNNRWCEFCSNHNKKTIEHVKQYIKKLHPNATVLSTKHIGGKKLIIICENKHKFKKLWNDIIHNSWCPYCAGLDKKSIPQVQQYLDEHHPGAKVISTEYKNNKTKLDIICEKGHKFKISWNSIDYWCTYCSECKNEKECRKIIEKLTGKKFIKCNPKWLKNPETNCSLQLDGYNEELKVAFEYQGQQHYKTGFLQKTKHYFTEEDIKKCQMRDELKKKLCEEHGVKLIVIPYWIEDKQKFIESILQGKNETYLPSVESTKPLL